MTWDIAWIVRPSKFPFGVADESLGVVHAATRDLAQTAAENQFGQHVVVERMTGSAAKRLSP